MLCLRMFCGRVENWYKGMGAAGCEVWGWGGGFFGCCFGLWGLVLSWEVLCVSGLLRHFVFLMVERVDLVGRLRIGLRVGAEGRGCEM